MVCAKNLPREREFRHKWIFLTILLLCQCMVRNFSSIDIGWVAIFSWNYSHLFVSTIPFLLQRWDCTWKLGLSSIQKYITALCMFAYRTKVDAVNEYYQLYYQLPKSTSMECVKHYVHLVITKFWPRYFWKPIKHT